jgi:hypothetical protein
LARAAQRVQGMSSILCLFTAMIALPGHARAAGAAYAVDTSDINSVGSCKVESWLSWASNQDFTGVTNPVCVVDFIQPIEVSAQIDRVRANDDWSTAFTPKLKMNLWPSEIGSFGLALSSAASFDAMTGDNTSMAIIAPATIRLSENMRINLNGGWLWDRVADFHYFTYGASFDLRTADNVWTLTAEVFGQAGQSDVPSVVEPRFQIGMRYRPGGGEFSMDLLYGRNIAGERANWITIATTIRFASPDK